MSGRRQEGPATRTASETPGVPESLARALERLDAGADRDQAVAGAPPTLRPEVASLLDARLVLPPAPALDPAMRSAIAAEIPGLDVALAPARARTAALRRFAVWGGLVVAVIGLLRRRASIWRSRRARTSFAPPWAHPAPAVWSCSSSRVR